MVVAANKLGVINHLLLTLEHASCRGLTVFGYVLNRLTAEPSLAADSNREVLLGLTAVPCLGELPYHPTESDQTLTLDADFDLTFINRLLGKL
jgi:dethiobiotin synthetase